MRKSLPRGKLFGLKNLNIAEADKLQSSIDL